MPTKQQLNRHLKRDRNGTYHAVFRDVNGKKHTRTTGTKNLDHAHTALREAKVLEVETARKHGVLTAETLTAIMAGKKITCADALEEWVTWRKVGKAPNTVRTQELIVADMLKRLNAGRWPVGKLTYEHLDSYVNNKDECGLSNRRVRISAIRSFFTLLTARAWYVGDPSKMLGVRVNDLSHEQKETIVRQPFTAAEFELIRASVTGFWRHWVALAYWAGLRMSDCAALEWASLTADTITVWTRKGKRRIALPFDDAIIGSGALRFTVFELMELGGKSAYVFPAEREVSLDPARRSRHSVYFGRVLERLGITGKSFHSLRYSFATRLFAAGKTIEAIGKAMGHSPKSTSVTAGYIKQ